MKAPQTSGPERRLKTLDRILSKAGLGSRTDARSWIGAGRVSVNGVVIRTPDHWVNPDRDSVELDGARIAIQKRIYILLYKPTGYLTSYGDPQKRPTVYDLISDLGTWVAPVGRLDLDTSGLLIMTNDNVFADHVTSPEGKVPKTYLVKTNSILTGDAIERLRSGVQLADGPTNPARVDRLRDSASSTFLEITITEGRNRQVRRMIEAVGSRVRKLVRTRIGDIQIGDLPIGKWRHLTPSEIRSLAHRLSHSKFVSAAAGPSSSRASPARTKNPSRRRS